MDDEPAESQDDRLLRDRATVDVALAEFNALRAELTTHMTGQNTMIGLGVTAIGVVVGLAFGGSGDRQLLAIVPIVASVIILTYCGEAYRIVSIGRYIRDVLWPFLSERTHDRLPSWEGSLLTSERGPGSIVESPVIVMFFVVGLITAFLADDIPVWIKALEAAAVAASLLFGIVLIRRRRR